MKLLVFSTVPYSTIQNRQSPAGAPEIGINILLDTEAFSIPMILDVTARSKAGFMLSISGQLLESELCEELLTKLYTLFALSDAFGNMVTRIPVFLAAEVQHVDKLIKLKAFFHHQGEHHIEFSVAQPHCNCVIQNQLFCSYAGLQALGLDHFRKHIEQKPEIMILSFDDPMQRKIPEPVSLSALLDQNPFASMLITVISANHAAALLRQQSVLWQNRAKVYLDFVTLGKKIAQDQYYGIKQWYEKEYEVLPLWFKRAGHIVKVFTGKRSFASLFNDKK